MDLFRNLILLLISFSIFQACSNKKENVTTANTNMTSQVKLLDDSIHLKIEKSILPEVVPKEARTGKIPESKNKEIYKLRKYVHVTELYMGLAQSTIDLCVENKVPPAAILAIVSLESGWASGYVGQITGNILSLNATKGIAELPGLYLPVHKESGKVLFDPKEIAKYDQNELEYQNRPASLKKDYRPANIAGTTNELAYFKYHPEERIKAQTKCINDFITRFVSHKSSIAAYREARTIMDDHVAKDGIAALFDKNVNIQFINTIGGRPNSFNFRETWPKKVETILNGAGLVELTKEMYLNEKNFAEAW